MALEPTVLEGAFAALLGDGSRADIVQSQQAAPEDLSSHYDVAIVTDGLPHEVDADVLITLPDTQVIGGDASVNVLGVQMVFEVRKESGQSFGVITRVVKELGSAAAEVGGPG